MTAVQPLTEASIQEFAVNWYVALDHHVPLEETLAMLDEELEFKVPEDTFLGHLGFARWYEAVTNRFFDEVHTVTKVESDISDGSATVRVFVNWQAKIWNPPAEKSQWLGFDADQTWTVVAGPDGPLIRSYAVNALDPMPGSSSL
ncbi:nuclear transport factor 2 family protein [Streptacidiphilus sp. N1-12]|uniref:Nuclear transport factor 2 family protein n=2 Tax=Streptacidiphilus alkalitolerans TaxID=3342712 RepID=A0ABV6V3I0_9ACTN